MTLVARLLPGVALLRGYDRGGLRGDLVAGLTVWALLVPQGLAYGQLAGLPPINGLYVGIAGMLAYALLGTSRWLMVGPESAVAMIVAVELGPLADGDQQRYAALAGLLALLVAGFLLIGFVARLGIITRLLSAPVLTGYLAGSGIVIAISQLPKLTGIRTDKQYPRLFGGLVHSTDPVNWWAVAIALGAGGVFLLLSRYVRKLPAGLVAMVLATVFVGVTGWASKVSVVGHVQSGLPTPGLPGAGLGDVTSLLAPAASIALLVFASGILTAQALARGTDEVRPNREFVALGAANLAAGLFHGFPANASDSRSFTAAASGGRSQVTGVVALALVVVTLLFLTPLVRNLPSAALGAVVVLTALKLIDVRELRRLFRVRVSDFALALVTLAGVLVFGVLGGIAVGVVASLVEVLRRAVMPHTAVLGRVPDSSTYRDAETFEDAETLPGLVIYRFDAPLFFANADVFRDQVLRLVADGPDREPVHEVLVNGEAIYDIDTTGIAMLERLHGELKERGVRLTFARVKTATREVMRRTGFEELVGADAFSLRVEDEVKAFAGSATPSPQPTMSVRPLSPPGR